MDRLAWIRSCPCAAELRSAPACGCRSSPHRLHKAGCMRPAIAWICPDQAVDVPLAPLRCPHNRAVATGGGSRYQLCHPSISQRRSVGKPSFIQVRHQSTYLSGYPFQYSGRTGSPEFLNARANHSTHHANGYRIGNMIRTRVASMKLNPTIHHQMQATHKPPRETTTGRRNKIPTSLRN
jgi:hypothetical protein